MQPMLVLQRKPVGFVAALARFGRTTRRTIRALRPRIKSNAGQVGGSIELLAAIERELAFLAPDREFLACYRGEIGHAECVKALEEKLQHIRILHKNLEKTFAQGDLAPGYHEVFGQVLAKKEQAILRTVNWIESGGMQERTVPKAGMAGSQARFALCEPDGEIRWVGLLNWQFDGLRVYGYDHSRGGPATISAMQILNWSDLSPLRRRDRDS